MVLEDESGIFIDETGIEPLATTRRTTGADTDTAGEKRRRHMKRSHATNRREHTRVREQQAKPSHAHQAVPGNLRMKKGSVSKQH